MISADDSMGVIMISADDTLLYRMPCRIAYTGPANTLRYFAPTMDRESGSLQCSFRGRGLQGHPVPLRLSIMEKEQQGGCWRQTALHQQYIQWLHDEPHDPEYQDPIRKLTTMAKLAAFV